MLKWAWLYKIFQTHQAEHLRSMHVTIYKLYINLEKNNNNNNKSWKRNNKRKKVDILH